MGQHIIVCSSNPSFWQVSLFSGLFETWQKQQLRTQTPFKEVCNVTYKSRGQSDLLALDLAFVQFLPEGVQFRILALAKTRVPGKEVVFFSPAVKKQCLVVSRKKTEKLRNHSSDSQASFLAYQKPYSPVSSK